MSILQAYPYTPTADRAAVVSRIMREAAKHETLFTDYQRAHDPVCAGTTCPLCSERLATVARLLSDPRGRSWEVWRLSDEASEIVGILYLTDLVSGCDAHAHYLFFDGNLKSKTALIEDMIQWAFSDHEDEGWRALQRLTVEVPEYAFALARHATKHLGFGGDYKYSSHGSTLAVEGVKRGALKWRGKNVDLLILGRQNPNG